MPGRSEPLEPNGGHWSESEVDPKAFKDARLGRRCADLLRRLSDRVGGTIPLACQDWANTKAAYRFFANPKVEEDEMYASVPGCILSNSPWRKISGAGQPSLFLPKFMTTNRPKR